LDYIDQGKLNKKEYLTNKIRNSMIDLGMPSNSVDTGFKGAQITEELEKSYFDFMRESFKLRISSDEDYNYEKYRQSKRFKYLESM